MGDFNCRGINWISGMVTLDELTKSEICFVRTRQENLFQQLIDRPTRPQRTDNPPVLDIVITNELL